MQMKACVFNGLRDISVEERTLISPAVGEVMVAVKACGVCGTDVHIYEGAEGAAPCVPPRILGHEMSGVVVQAGPGVITLKVGGTVCIDPNNSCGGCEHCRSGRPHYCGDMICYGTVLDGGFAEYITVRASACSVVSGALEFEEYAMAEPVACCLHGIDGADIKPGCDVFVIGGGTIGLLMLQLAYLCGAARVALSDPVESRRALALELGASDVFDPTAGNLPEAVRAAGYKRLQSVIECVGAPATMSSAIELTGECGTAMLFGLTAPAETIALKPFDVFKRDLTIRASFINPYTMPRAVALIESGRLNIKPLIAERLPLESLKGVLDDPAKRRGGKVIITP